MKTYEISEIEISYKKVVQGKIGNSDDALEILRPLYGNHMNLKEAMWMLLFDRRNQVIGVHKISEGGIAGTVCDPKLVFSVALKSLASGIILSHNHPSGIPEPSQMDIQLTKRLKEAGKLLEITILDHIIVCEDKHFSFADQGLV